MIEKLSDFDKIWCVFGLKYDDSKYQVSSKSDHFWAWFWLPIGQFVRSQSVTWWNNLLLHKFSPRENGFSIGSGAQGLHFTSSLKNRGSRHSQTGHQKSKIFYLVNLLPDRVDWNKFQENWRFWVCMTFCGLEKRPVNSLM